MTKKCLCLAFILLVFAELGCGVKGKPMPPLDPPQIGRGDSAYSGSTKNKKPVVNKYNNKDDADDASEKDE